ncbi:copper resistance protein CopC [Glaciimonas soli]|uniref:Copper resistance protein CopC n=1 Tax=Glaciimonas soli TaxID=2590999 RepID=A0A843YRN9_9BURK|nr:copper resistance protein CopC [Glaciimonas soli]MQR02419.1 copper resistance protein CopC [Glaciimonas soli]
MTFPRAFVLLLSLVISLFIANFAHAHAHPVTQTPAADSAYSIGNAPSEVSITYDEALEPAFSKLAVTDAQGKAITINKAEVDTTTHKTLRVALSKLVAGIYLVKWVAVADDGHRTQGSYKFTVK